MKTRTPKLWHGGERCECSVCHQFFSTTANFDAHRQGPYDGERRCLSPAEIAAKGYIEKDGVWLLNKPRPERLNYV